MHIIRIMIIIIIAIITINIIATLRGGACPGRRAPCSQSGTCRLGFARLGINKEYTKRIAKRLVTQILNPHFGGTTCLALLVYYGLVCLLWRH